MIQQGLGVFEAAAGSQVHIKCTRDFHVFLLDKDAKRVGLAGPFHGSARRVHVMLPDDVDRVEVDTTSDGWWEASWRSRPPNHEVLDPKPLVVQADTYQKRQF